MLSINSLINIDDSCNIYSAAVLEDREICLPVTSKSCVYFFSLDNKNLKTELKLDNLKPDIAIYLDSRNVLIGCQDTSPPLIVSKNEVADFVDVPKDNFFPTSLKKAPNGNIFIGNLKGNPIIYEHHSTHQININSSSTYDCFWIDDEFILVSCIKDGTIKLVQLIAKGCKIIQELDILYPYRFSPFANNKVLLTSKGWTDRPGKVIVLSIKFSKSFGLKVPSIEVLKEIIIPQELFTLQRRLPSSLLNLKGFEKYIGYINDVAWWDEDHFVITTRTGNAIILINLEGEIKYIFRMNNFRPTRFISSRLPYERILLVDAFQSRILELKGYGR